MRLSSPAFENNQLIPKKYTCDGDNINPPLLIRDVPKNTKSLVLIVKDPDVSSGEFIHWILWNIDPRIKNIEKNSTPDGAVIGRNDFGERCYKGPCPPGEMHIYLFKLYAVDGVLPNNPELKKKQIRKMIEGHILSKALLKGFYERMHSENF